MPLFHGKDVSLVMLPQCQSRAGVSLSCWTSASWGRSGWELDFKNLPKDLDYVYRLPWKLGKQMSTLSKAGYFPQSVSQPVSKKGMELLGQLKIHLVQGRIPPPVGSSLTDAVCRLVAHQDPGDGEIPGMEKWNFLEKVFSSLFQTTLWSPEGWIVVPLPMQIRQVKYNGLAWIQQRLVPFLDFVDVNLLIV